MLGIVEDWAVVVVVEISGVIMKQDFSLIKQSTAVIKTIPLDDEPVTWINWK
jgi:hypothetical protein